MSDAKISRRQFISSSTHLAKGSLIALSLPAILTACGEARELQQSGADFKNLSADEAAEFAAIAARIIPSDETPGATEAGVIYFMDNVLSDPVREEILAELRNGLFDLQAQAALSHDESFFHLLATEQQDDLLRANETTAFFNTVRYLTIAGTFSLPEYGGNRDNVGNNIIGMEFHNAWAPPYGFYDADYMERGE